WPGWRDLARLFVPGIDACLLVTPQHRAHLLRNPGRTRPRLLQQLREQRPHLRHRHRRIFFSPAAPTPTAETTTPAALASCGAPSPPTTAPRSGSALPLGSPPRTTPPPAASPHAPLPPPPTAPL